LSITLPDVPNHDVARVCGPFHRLAATTQTVETMRNVLVSGELWGRRPFQGSSPFPAVQAFSGNLPDSEEGFEFWTFAAPDPNYGPVAYWRRTGRHDGLVRADAADTVAKIDVLVTKVSWNQLS
jgi:hypothetical protein